MRFCHELLAPVKGQGRQMPGMRERTHKAVELVKDLGNGSVNWLFRVAAHDLHVQIGVRPVECVDSFLGDGDRMI